MYERACARTRDDQGWMSGVTFITLHSFVLLCFARLYVCGPYVGLVPTEIRRGNQIPGTRVKEEVAALPYS